MKGAGRQRRGALQHPFRGDAGQDGRRGRTFKRNGRAEHRDRGIDFRDCEPAGKAAPRQIRCRHSRGELGKLRHALAIITVRDVSGGEGQERSRNELHQPDEAEIERAAGQRINLPADRHRPDLVAELGEAAGGEVK